MTAVLILHWLGAGFVALALVAAAGVVTARTHFASCVHLAVISIFAALALLCFGAGDAALAAALVGVGVAPVVLLGGILLSAPAIRAKPRTTPWLSAVAAAATGLALLWSTQDAAPLQVTLAPPVGLGVWLAALVLVAGFACAGLLGYGERGALEPIRDEPGA